MSSAASASDEVDDDDEKKKPSRLSVSVEVEIESSSSADECESTTSSISRSSFESKLQRGASRDIVPLRQIHEIPKEIGGVPLPCLEAPSSGPAEFSSLVIKDSRGPHIGNTIIYEQPITIRQIVYANGVSAAAGQEDSVERDDESCASSEQIIANVASEKRLAKSSAQVTFAASKLSLTKIDKSEGQVQANDFARRKKQYIYAAIGATSTIIIVAVVLSLTLPVKSVNEPSDEAEVTVTVTPTHDEPTTPAEVVTDNWYYVNRSTWQARPSRRELPPLSLSPVPYLIVGETGSLADNCLDGRVCSRLIRQRQSSDMTSLGCDDIRHNFLVAGDGLVYEGRGWSKAGQHTSGYDERSLGLAFAGRFDAVEPSQRQMEAARTFIDRALAQGHLAENYRVYGEKQLRVEPSSSPGERLYNALKNWSHWSPIAPSDDDTLR